MGTSLNESGTYGKGLVVFGSEGFKIAGIEGSQD